MASLTTKNALPQRFQRMSALPLFCTPSPLSHKARLLVRFGFCAFVAVLTEPLRVAGRTGLLLSHVLCSLPCLERQQLSVPLQKIGGFVAFGQSAFVALVAGLLGVAVVAKLVHCPTRPPLFLPKFRQLPPHAL